MKSAGFLLFLSALASVAKIGKWFIKDEERQRVVCVFFLGGGTIWLLKWGGEVI